VDRGAYSRYFANLFCLRNTDRVVLEATFAVKFVIHGIKW
jgi:hypothetical protein